MARTTKTLEPVKLPSEGIGPNEFARIMKSQNALLDRVADIADAQEIGKRHFRPFLRARFAEHHAKHSSWNLTAEMQSALLDQFGNDRAKEAVARAAASAKRKAAPKRVKPIVAEPVSE